MTRNHTISYLVFIPTLIVVLFSLISVVFPALIFSIVSPHGTTVDPFEFGHLAVPLLIINPIIIGIGVAYHKKRIPTIIHRIIHYVLNFEISKKTALISGIILLSIYIGFTVGELSNDDSVWPDHDVLMDSLEVWPSTQSDDIYVQEQTSRYVKMFLLSASHDVFQNIKFLPFLASVLLVVLVYFFTYEISQKRFAGIVSMLVLIQSYTFLQYDTIAVYENFWVLFYVFSLFVIYKKWSFISPAFYFLSVFTKAFAFPYFILSIFFILREEITKKKKIVLMIGYAVILSLIILIFLLGESVYRDLVTIDTSEFWIGFSGLLQLRFDYFIMMTILPLVVGLFFISKRGVKTADSILVLFLGMLLAQPILVMMTDFYVILPYRFVPMIVFFSIGAGLLLSKKISN